MFTFLRALFSLTVLLVAKLFSTIFYRFKSETVTGSETPIAWGDIRLVVVLNHTSLFEWLYVGAMPIQFLWRAAKVAVIPVADKTLRRPAVGVLFKMLTRDVISVTRQPDATWQAVVEKADGDRMVVIFPEGRMMRANGLDKNGLPMTVRGGVADILKVMDKGKMLIAYSAGLHHVQVPGQHFPNLFQTLRIRFDQVDIADYRESMNAKPGSSEFKQAVKIDLQDRRDRHCEWK